jgi:hypothetical protein
MVLSLPTTARQTKDTTGFSSSCCFKNVTNRTWNRQVFHRSSTPTTDVHR